MRHPLRIQDPVVYAATQEYIESHGLTGATKGNVLLAVSSFAGLAGTAYPANKTLAAMVSRDKRTVQRVIEELCRDGHLVRELRGQGETNLYSLPFLRAVKIDSTDVTPSVTPSIPSTAREEDSSMSPPMSPELCTSVEESKEEQINTIRVTRRVAPYVEEKQPVNSDLRSEVDAIIRSRISPAVENLPRPEESARYDPASHPYWSRAREIQIHYAAELVRRGWSKPQWEKDNARQVRWTWAILRLLDMHVDWADNDLVEKAIVEVLDANEARARGYAGPDGPGLLGSDVGAAVSRMASAQEVSDVPVLRAVRPGAETPGSADFHAEAMARFARSPVVKDGTPRNVRKPTIHEVVAQAA